MVQLFLFHIIHGIDNNSTFAFDLLYNQVCICHGSRTGDEPAIC